jgi:hypothetical protein
MAKTYKLVSVIFCDDCRREDNGKDIIIGTYNGALVSPILPLIMPTFVLRFEVLARQSEFKRTVAIMKSPRGEEMFRLDGTLAVQRPEFNASFFFKVSPLVISQAGKHTVHLGLDEDPEEVATFTVLQEPVDASA